MKNHNLHFCTFFLETLYVNGEESEIVSKYTRVEFVKGNKENPKINAIYVMMGEVEDVPETDYGYSAYDSDWMDENGDLKEDEEEEEWEEEDDEGQNEWYSFFNMDALFAVFILVTCFVPFVCYLCILWVRFLLLYENLKWTTKI